MTDAQQLLQVFILALAIYREARGEPAAGKLAVGWVIRNRVADQRWPETYRDVILQPFQFSAFNKNDSQSTVFPKAESDAAWEGCVSAAREVLNGATDFTNGANHYFADTIEPPNWADPQKHVVSIGHHKFYKL